VEKLLIPRFWRCLLPADRWASWFLGSGAQQAAAPQLENGASHEELNPGGGSPPVQTRKCAPAAGDLEGITDPPLRTQPAVQLSSLPPPSGAWVATSAMQRPKFRGFCMEFSGRRSFEEFVDQVAKSSPRFGTENFIQKPRSFGRCDSKVSISSSSSSRSHNTPRLPSVGPEPLHQLPPA
jgi:hypothetical protein